MGAYGSRWKNRGDGGKSKGEGKPKKSISLAKARALGKKGRQVRHVGREEKIPTQTDVAKRSKNVKTKKQKNK